VVDSQRKMLVAELLSQQEPLFVGTMNKLFRKSVHLTSLMRLVAVFASLVPRDYCRFQVLTFGEQVLMLRSLGVPAFHVVFYDNPINLFVVYATLKQSPRTSEGFSLHGVNICKQHPIFLCTLLRAMHRPYWR